MKIIFLDFDGVLNSWAWCGGLFNGWIYGRWDGLGQAFIGLMGVFLAVVVGYRFGYHHGFADSEWSHDFDRCPHCGEALHTDQP